MDEAQVKAHKTLIKFANGLLILAGLLGSFGVYFLFVGNETQQWPSASGRLMNVALVTHIDSDPVVTRSTKRLEIEYFIRLDYSYEVNGQSYFSSRYSYGNGNVASDYFPSEEVARTEAQKTYGSVKDLTVFYDPEDPSESVLKPGWNLGTFVPVLMALFFAACGWFVRWALLKAQKKA